MAKRTVGYLVDDLTGEELAPGAGETVKLGLDGVTYQLDLTASNAAHQLVWIPERSGRGQRRTACQ